MSTSSIVGQNSVADSDPLNQRFIHIETNVNAICEEVIQLRTSVDRLTKALEKQPMVGPQLESPPQHFPEPSGAQGASTFISPTPPLKGVECDPRTFARNAGHFEGPRFTGYQPQPHPQYPPQGRGYMEHPRYDDLGDIIKGLKFDVASYDGRFDPTAFSDWIVALESFFSSGHMSDRQKILYTSLKLTGAAKLFWQRVVRERETARLPPFERWEDMRTELHRKYLPPYYRDQLYEQMMNLRQSSSSVQEYMARFDELTLRCDLREESWRTVSRFTNGLKLEFKQEVQLFQPRTLEEAFQKACAIEELYRTILRRDGSQPKPILSHDPPRSTVSPFVASRGSNNPIQSGPPKQGQSFTSPTSRPSGSGIQCHRCHSWGHYANRCPQRTLLLDQGLEPHSDSLEVEQVDALADHIESEDEDFQGEGEKTAIMRCLLSTPREEEDWKRTNIFFTILKCKDKLCRMVIDGGSTMNVVSTHALKRFSLSPEPHPKPFRVVWVDRTSLPVSDRCLVPIQMGEYSDRIWCDVLPMDVAHVLLGRPWLFDRDVEHRGKANTYTFYHQGRPIQLNPIKPHSISGQPTPTSQVPSVKPQVLALNHSQIPTTERIQLVNYQEFPQSSSECGLMLALVAKEPIDVHRRNLAFHVGDYVMVRVRPERFSNHSFHKPHACSFGPYRVFERKGSNAYLIDLPSNMSINLTFNVADLYPYRGTLESPRWNSNSFSGTRDSPPMSTTVPIAPRPIVPTQDRFVDTLDPG